MKISGLFFLFQLFVSHASEVKVLCPSIIMERQCKGTADYVIPENFNATPNPYVDMKANRCICELKPISRSGCTRWNSVSSAGYASANHALKSQLVKYFSPTTTQTKTCDYETEQTEAGITLVFRRNISDESN